MLVCTMGELHVLPNVVNVIACSATFTIDIRSRSDELRQQVVRSISETIDGICSARLVDCNIEERHSAAAVQANPEVMNSLAKAVHNSKALLVAASNQSTTPPAASRSQPEGSCAAPEGTSDGSSSADPACAWPLPNSDPEKVPVLVSGAGHDAMAIADIAKMGMLFVQCSGGISHHPSEYVAPQDVAAATVALAYYLQNEAGVGNA